MRKIKEVGFTKYLPFVVKKNSFKNFEARFAIDMEDMQVRTDSEGWVNAASFYDREKIEYKVNISGGGNSSIIPINRDNIEDSIRVFTHTVTFTNDTAGMNDLKSNIGFVVFSTIGKVLNEFVKEYPKKFQCFYFIPAYTELTPVYDILSKEAEKQGFLIYANKNIGKRTGRWYLLNKKIWDKYKQIKGIDK